MVFVYTEEKGRHFIWRLSIRSSRRSDSESSTLIFYGCQGKGGGGRWYTWRRICNRPTKISSSNQPVNKVQSTYTKLHSWMFTLTEGNFTSTLAGSCTLSNKNNKIYRSVQFQNAQSTYTLWLAGAATTPSAGTTFVAFIYLKMLLKYSMKHWYIWSECRIVISQFWIPAKPQRVGYYELTQSSVQLSFLPSVHPRTHSLTCEHKHI